MKKKLSYSKSDIVLFVINILFGAVIVVFGYTIVFQHFIYYTFSYYHLSTIGKESRKNTINLIPSQLLALFGSFWFFGVTVSYFLDLFNIRNLHGRTNGKWSGLTGIEEKYQSLFPKIQSVQQKISLNRSISFHNSFSSSYSLDDDFIDINQIKNSSSDYGNIQDPKNSQVYPGINKQKVKNHIFFQENEHQTESSTKEEDEKENESENGEGEEFLPLLFQDKQFTDLPKDFDQNNFQNQDHQLRTVNRIIRIFFLQVFKNSNCVRNKILSKNDLFNHYFCLMCYVISFIICSIVTLIYDEGVLGLWKIWFNLTITPHLFGLILFIIVEYYLTISKLLVGSAIIQIKAVNNSNRFLKKNFGFVEIISHFKYQINKSNLVVYLIPSLLYLGFSIICSWRTDLCILKKIFILIMNFLNIFLLLYYIILLKLSLVGKLKDKKKKKTKKNKNKNKNDNNIIPKKEKFNDQQGYYNNENILGDMDKRHNYSNKKGKKYQGEAQTKTERINSFIRKHWDKFFAVLSLVFGLVVVILSIIRVTVLKKNQLPSWILIFLLITIILGFLNLHLRSLPDMSRHTLIVIFIIVIFMVFLIVIQGKSKGPIKPNENIQGHYPWCDFMNDTGRLDIIHVSSLAYASYHVGLDNFDEILNKSLPIDWINWPITKNQEYTKWFCLYDQNDNNFYIAISGTQLDHWSTVLLDCYYWSAIASLQIADLVYPYLKLSNSKAISLSIFTLTQIVEIFYPSMNHFYNDVQDYTQKLIDDADPSNPPNIFLIGHSLGGGIASIVSSSFDKDDLKKKNMLNKIKSITFNAPGISYSRKKFLFGKGEKIILENINRNSISVKAQYDLVSRIDMSQGIVQYIECLEKNPFSCHSLINELKVLWNGCGREGVPPFLD
ncbi:alpha/beta-hydrolases superfamily protein [Anaeramoeba flamelloides]|uniref:Alpha/beta-hydrolases superfamily protein n=1 Tax=Anaeramoeba flamelloides TaxID=1746091 RepID=A0AAV7ZRG6_9EUKA|nr:alpha/beta-hydrolases superfamily protein [Anaeramoeba flamelloides]